MKGKYKVFAGVDLSTKKRAGTCIFTLAKTTKEGKYIPLDIRVGKWTGPKLLENILSVQKLFSCHSFLVENNALQDMVIDLLKEYVKERKIDKRPFIKGRFTGSNKLDIDHGLGSMEVDFYNERWQIPESDINHKMNCRCGFCRWKNEVIGYPFFSTDDVLMASWFARENARKSSIGRIRLL